MLLLSQFKFIELRFRVSAKILEMKKDARLTFRVPSGLKKNIEEIANREGYSAGQICEAFLLAGSEAYKKQGSKFVQKMLVRLITKSSN